MKLVIAEKPSVARAIQEAIGNEFTVIALRGHIYEQASPDEYVPDDVPLNGNGNKKWREIDLPIIPNAWHRNLRSECEGIRDKVLVHLRQTTEVIHAGDADREGQWLVDEVLEEMGYRGPVSRIWLQSLTPASIQQAFRKKRSNSEYKSLSDSALARSRADWLVGNNLTRAYSFKLKKNNHHLGTISIGRVQTPTLAMIVNRDRQIESFMPWTYLEIHATARHSLGDMTLTWKPGKPFGKCFDESGLLTSGMLAHSILASAQGIGIVTEYREEAFPVSPPLPFNLSELQKLASQKFGMTATEVLNACQSLYESGAITYPRTNCRNVPVQEMASLRNIASSLNLSPVAFASESLHDAFDDTRVTAHTAILPTDRIPENLSGHARWIYDLISKSATALFMPPAKCLNISATVKLNGESWVIQSRRTTDKGWTTLSPERQEEFIPPLKPGDRIEFTNAEIVYLDTKPVERYTDGSLIDDMVNIHRHVADPKHQAILHESGGLGTDATRATIIEELISKELVTRKDQYLISTAKGRILFDSLQPELCDPMMTAHWEQKLSMILDGKLDLDDFQSDITDFVRSQVALALRK